MTLLTSFPVARVLRALALSALALGAAPAPAQDLTAGDWKFRAQIYGWFPTIGGSSEYPQATGGVSASLDFSNYMDALQFAFMGTFEARKGKLGLLTDYIYLSFDADKAASRDLTFTGPLGHISLPADVSAAVTVDLRGWAWSLLGTYALVDTPQYEVQLLGGLRYLKIDTTLGWRLTGNVGPLPPAVRSGASTVKPDAWDGVIGAKGRIRLGNGQWFAPYYLDIGAGQSDLTWQAMGGVGYAFSWGEIIGAYRHLDYSFGSGKRIDDLSFSGPALSFGFRW